MSKLERFEELITWQKARDLTKLIYTVSSKGLFARDFGLRDQIRRASVSVMSNIAEGFERTGPAEFHHFLSIAKGSCAEARSLVYVSWDATYLMEQEFNELLSKAHEVGRVMGGLRVAISKRRDEQRGGV